MKGKLHPLSLLVLGLVSGLILHYTSVQVINALKDDPKSLLNYMRPILPAIPYVLWTWFFAGKSPEKESENLKEEKDKRYSNSSYQRNKQQAKGKNSKQSPSGPASADLSIDAACQEVGIHPTHTHDQLKIHWRIVCRQWHPDTGGSHALWIRKQHAYEMLLRRAREQEGLC